MHVKPRLGAQLLILVALLASPAAGAERAGPVAAAQLATFVRFAIVLEKNALHNRTKDKAAALTELRASLGLLQQVKALGVPAAASSSLDQALLKDDDAITLLPTVNAGKVYLDIQTALIKKEAVLGALGEPVAGSAIVQEAGQKPVKPLPPEPPLPPPPPKTAKPPPTTREKVIKLIDAALVKENAAAAAFDQLDESELGYNLLDQSVIDLIFAARTAAGDPSLRNAEIQIHDALDHDYEIGKILLGASDGCEVCEAEDAYDHKLNALEDLGVKVGTPSFRILPISAVFVPTKLATNYSVGLIRKPAGVKLAYDWVLSLGLVDEPGAPAPGNPDSGAEIDPTCNNAYLPGGNLVLLTPWSITYEWEKLQDEFIWYHGDKGAYPGSDYGCDHTRMGPSGHQGIVSVTVSEGDWSCTSAIDGSNLGLTPELGFTSPCRYLPT